MLSLKLKTKKFMHTKFAVSIFISMAFFFVGASSASAATTTMTSVIYTPSGAVVGTYIAASATTTTFTIISPAPGLGAGSTTILYFPTGTTFVGNTVAGDFRIRQASDGGASCVNGVETAPSAIATTSTTLLLTLQAASLSNSCDTLSSNGRGEVTVKLSSAAGGDEIRHPTAITTTGTFQADATSNLVDGSTGATSTVIFIADAATDVRVETAANGSGAVVQTQDLSNNSTLTAYSVTRDQYGNFVANTAADAWSLTDKTGDIRDVDLGAAGDSKSATFAPALFGTTKIQATEGALTVTKSGTLTVISAGGSVTFDYWGCTNLSATNYNSLANKDDGSCKIAGEASPATPAVAATPAIPATPATPTNSSTPATPAIPATPATPAVAATPVVPAPASMLNAANRKVQIAELIKQILLLIAELQKQLAIMKGQAM